MSSEREIRRDQLLAYIIVGVLAVAMIIVAVGFCYEHGDVLSRTSAKPAPAEKVESPKPLKRVTGLPTDGPPIRKTSGSVPDKQEEALNKMGLTKQGGAKPDLSGMVTSASLKSAIKK